MEKKFLISILLVVILIISGCTASEQENEGNPSGVTPEETIVIDEQVDENTTSSNEVFSVNINNTNVSLKAWEHETNLELLLGKPIAQDIENLKGDG